MSDLISRSALLEKMKKTHRYFDVKFDIEEAPAVDAVPVVRCKDCKHWEYEYDDVGLCVTDVPDIDGVERVADDFCSYGERKEE